MAYDYNSTHEKIIKSAKELFLKNGYERTNLRQICSSAGVTNGAFYRHFKSKEDLFSVLVEPCVKRLKEIYFRSEEECFKILENNSVESAMEITTETTYLFIDYIYDNFEVFRLLLLCAGGTKYDQFIEQIVELEVRESFKFFDQVVKTGIKITIPSEKSIHMLSHCYINTLFECVVHEYKKEDTLKEIETLVDFFNAGWKKILSI